jgi:putative acetyltransferase
MIQLLRTNSLHPAFGSLIIELDKDLWSRYDDRQAAYDVYNKIPEIDTVVIALYNNEPAGCGCFKSFDKTSIEIKRMFVAPGKRNLGIASAILTELELWTAELQFSHTVLETGTKQFEAINFYKKLGYTIIENYGQYIDMPDSICMKKKLSS